MRLLLHWVHATLFLFIFSLLELTSHFSSDAVECTLLNPCMNTVFVHIFFTKTNFSLLFNCCYMYFVKSFYICYAKFSGSNFNKMDIVYTHAAVIRFPSRKHSSMLFIFIYLQVWTLEFVIYKAIVFRKLL